MDYSSFAINIYKCFFCFSIYHRVLYRDWQRISPEGLDRDTSFCNSSSVIYAHAWGEHPNKYGCFWSRSCEGNRMTIIFMNFQQFTFICTHPECLILGTNKQGVGGCLCGSKVFLCDCLSAVLLEFFTECLFCACCYPWIVSCYVLKFNVCFCV